MTRFAIPFKGLGPVLFSEEPPIRLHAPHFLPYSLRPSFGVAILTGGRDLRAAPPRIERMIGPFDSRILPHSLSTLKSGLCGLLTATSLTPKRSVYTLRNLGSEPRSQFSQRAHARCILHFSSVDH